MRVSILKLFLILIPLLFGNVSVYAEVCTYNEAIMALKQGNTVRGTALLKMAANDGDQRAIHFLAERKKHNMLLTLVADQKLSVPDRN